MDVNHDVLPLAKEIHIIIEGRQKNMGNISVLARRRADGTVQYGWSGNMGYFRNVGMELFHWYNDPDMVDYLFDLGQLSNLSEPYTENNEELSIFFRNCPTGSPHWVSSTEADIFSKLLFAEHGYFYDSDGGWYYVAPGPFILKIPFLLVMSNLDNNDLEFKFLEKCGHMVAEYIINDYPKTDPKFAAILAAGYGKSELRELLDAKYPLLELSRQYPELRKYFDDWVVIVPDVTEDNVAGILMRKREEPRTETIGWPGHPRHKAKSYTNPVIVEVALAHVGRWLGSILEEREYNKNRVAAGEPGEEGLQSDIPEWFLEEFRSAVGDDTAAAQLIRQRFTDLHHVSESFDAKLEEGFSLGRVQYEKLVEKYKNR